MKILSVFLVLVFVKTQTDLWIYALILALSVFVGQSVVWFALKQYVSWRRPSWANMKQHIRPLFVLFLPILALSLYKYMDKIMLGSISSNVQVGFYENAEKIINVPMSLIMAFGVVLMPRIANMVTSKDKGEVFKLIDMSMEAVMLLAIAISFGLAGISFVLAPIFFGYEFEECGILIMGLAVTVPFMAFANVIRTQYLIPYKEDKIFVVSLFLGAAVNLIVNIILIPYMAARGAVIGTIFAEIIVCIYQSYFVRKKIFIKKYLLNTIPPILIGIVMFVFVFQIGNVMQMDSNPGKISVSDATAHAACLTARDVNAAAIVTVSESGTTARLLSKYRPQQPIIACVMREQVQRQLSLSWGITPLMMSLAHSTDELIEMSTALAKENGYLHNGELAVVTAGVPVGVSGTTNMIKIHMVGNCLATGVGVGPENNDVASGKACVCRTMDEVRAKFKPGMVLVVPSTSNEMLSFVRDAAALVVEEPGLNSHAAIAGKALLKPTVVGAAGATSHIRDGLMVAVDCAHGSVQRLQG